MNTWEMRHETLKIGDYSLYLGLLEHNFRNRNAIRLSGMLPGQVFAPIPLIPFKDRKGKFVIVIIGVRHERILFSIASLINTI
jgi:hypothetical protein